MMVWLTDPNWSPERFLTDSVTKRHFMRLSHGIKKRVLVLLISCLKATILKV